MMTTVQFPHSDSSNCLQSALAYAEKRCQQQHARLTPVRRQVLALILASAKPVGAYTLLEQLRQHKRADPPTIYRALEFLLEQGFIHRINSLNAFIGCICPEHPHSSSYFLICQYCNEVTELKSPELDNLIQIQIQPLQFAAYKQMIEVIGCCHKCQPLALINE